MDASTVQLNYIYTMENIVVLLLTDEIATPMHTIVY